MIMIDQVVLGRTRRITSLMFAYLFENKKSGEENIVDRGTSREAKEKTTEIH
jgi:hypothetical protein